MFHKNFTKFQSSYVNKKNSIAGLKLIQITIFMFIQYNIYSFSIFVI